MQENDAKSNNTKGSAKRSAFLNYYLSEQLNGKPNPYFGNAFKSAKKVGYSETYATQVLGRMTKQNNPAGATLVKVRKDLDIALAEQGVDTDWLANLVYRLGNKTDKRIIDRKLVDTGDPDAQSARAALDFIAKTQGMYEPEKHNGKYDMYTREQMIDFLVAKLSPRQ